MTIIIVCLYRESRLGSNAWTAHNPCRRAVLVKWVTFTPLGARTHLSHERSHVTVRSTALCGGYKPEQSINRKSATFNAGAWQNTLQNHALTAAWLLMHELQWITKTSGFCWSSMEAGFRVRGSVKHDVTRIASLEWAAQNEGHIAFALTSHAYIFQ